MFSMDPVYLNHPGPCIDPRRFLADVGQGFGGQLQPGLSHFGRQRLFQQVIHPVWGRTGVGGVVRRGDAVLETLDHGLGDVRQSQGVVGVVVLAESAEGRVVQHRLFGEGLEAFDEVRVGVCHDPSLPRSLTTFHSSLRTLSHTFVMHSSPACTWPIAVSNSGPNSSPARHEISTMAFIAWLTQAWMSRATCAGVTSSYSLALSVMVTSYQEATATCTSVARVDPALATVGVERLLRGLVRLPTVRVDGDALDDLARPPFAHGTGDLLDASRDDVLGRPPIELRGHARALSIGTHLVEHELLAVAEEARVVERLDGLGVQRTEAGDVVVRRVVAVAQVGAARTDDGEYGTGVAVDEVDVGGLHDPNLP